MNLPALFAGASLWLHLSAAMLWTGGMAFFLFVFAPAARALAPAEGIRALERGRQSIQTLSWIAIHVMFLTGVLNFLFRAGAPRDAGYYMILAVKLLLFLAMAFHHSLQVFKYSPKIATAASAAARAGGGDAWPEPLRAPLTKWFMLLKINATLGFIVLLLGLGLSWR